MLVVPNSKKVNRLVGSQVQSMRIVIDVFYEELFDRRLIHKRGNIWNGIHVS